MSIYTEKTLSPEMDIKGLTSQEVAERRSAGLVNSSEQAVSRTYRDIVFKNVFTSFNIILFILGAALLVLNDPVNALAATGIIIMNILVATFQEIRAKRRLDSIALLLRPKVRVVRDGAETEIDQSGIVKDDMIHLTAGDQALVDGELLELRSMEMDESLLTGESSTVRKKVGSMVYSGSFCVTGEGYYRVTAFGADSFASKMLASAKKYTTKNTPLQMETAAMTKFLMGIAFAYLIVTVVINMIYGNDLQTLVKTAVIIIDIVPIALFLLIVITYMIAAVRIADSGVLLQRSNAVESMSHVDTVCMDKTGTITTNRLVYEGMVPFTDPDEAERLAALFASATGSKNRTVQAMTAALGTVAFSLLEEIQFSSERKYSAVRISEGGSETVLYMGAWSALGSRCRPAAGAEEALAEASSRGLRTLVLCRAGEGPITDDAEYLVPEDMEVVCVILVSDEIRPDCRETIGVFLDNGMDLKVISGDDPATVDALFTLADIPGERRIMSGDELDALSGEDRARAILDTNIFGRMKPDHKQEIISTLKDRGRYVAMVGDGVNDVKSLKEAQVGIAMQSGSGAARGVADMIIINDRFSALPDALVEGRRTVSGMRDILKLYLTRNFVLAMLVLVILIGGAAIGANAVPLLPTQISYYAVITVSISAFMMAIWAAPSENKGAVLPGVMSFAIPMAALIAVFGMIVYAVFWTGTVDGWIVVDYTDKQLASMGWPTIYDVTDPAIHEIGRIAGINAMNGMLIFLVMAGITQLLMITPRWRFLSLDGNTHPDIRPTVLVFLLYGLMILVYTVPVPELCDLLGISRFQPVTLEVFLALAGLTAVWFLVSRYALRSGRLMFLYRFTDAWFRRKMTRVYGHRKE